MDSAVKCASAKCIKDVWTRQSVIVNGLHWQALEKI